MLLGRSGKKKQTDEVTRRCIATGEILPTAELIRFVLSPDGTVTPDLAARLPGRGLWVNAESKALALAIKRNGFSKSAKTQAKIPDGLAGLVDQLMTKRLIDLISLARKSGHAICGYEKVKSALIAEGVSVLVQAQDGSVPQKRKLRPPLGSNTYISCLSAAELGLAFGRDYVIHAALAPGGMTKTVKTEAARLAGLRGRDAKTEAKQPDNLAVKG